MAEVGQLLTAWNLYKAFGKEFLELGINGDDLMNIEEAHFKHNRNDYPNAQNLHIKLLFKKLRDISGSAGHTVSLYRPSGPPQSDTSKLAAVFAFLETGSTDGNAATTTYAI